MTKSRQEILEDAWLQGSVGSLSALSQAKLWAARAVWRADKKSDHGVQSFAARLVKKCGTDEHPSQSAVRQFYAKIDADPAWFPGKIYRENSGPSRVLSGQQTAAIARSAEAMKRRGAEPTYPRLVGTCPTATLNRGTGAPVSKKKRVYAVFREQCKDERIEQVLGPQSSLFQDRVDSGDAGQAVGVRLARKELRAYPGIRLQARGVD